MASCDGQVHVWDVETNSTLGIYEFGKQGVSRIAHVPGQSCVAVATADGRTAFVDPRVRRVVREWLTLPPLAPHRESLSQQLERRTVQVMTSDAEGRSIFMGMASGRIVALDARMGLLDSTWTAHDGEVTDIVPLNSERIISSSMAGQLQVLDTPSRTTATRCKLPHNDAVLSLSLIGKDLVALQAANRISVFSQLERQPPTATGESHRLRHLRGSSATVLRSFPLNQWLLVGTEGGPLSLFA